MVMNNILIIVPFLSVGFHSAKVPAFTAINMVKTQNTEVSYELQAPSEERSVPVIQAVKTDAVITIDGRLDEEAWQKAPVISGFRQVEPEQGEPARHHTEVRVLYNERFIYIGARMYDEPGNKPRVTSLSRDFGYFENDLFGVVFDTFNNERDAISFQVTPYGNQRDLQVFDDAVFNRDFEVVWHAETEILEDGWVVEMAIPWSSLRYNETNDTWGINFIRRHRRSNEESAWSPWPRAYRPYRVSYAGKLTGIVAPPPSINLRVQPYALTEANRIYGEGNPDYSPKLGGEIKWAPSRNSVLDLTFNTDFAQAEADQQVINLTQFPVVFPEKRQFFLENANLFDVGRIAWLKPFFTRRIGLTLSGEPVPIDAGIRFTDQSVDRSFGALLMRQRDQAGFPASWFGVGRYVENFGNGKRAGIMVTARQDEAMHGQSSNANITGSVDTFMRFSSRVSLAGSISGMYDEQDQQWGHASDLWLAYLDNFMYLGLLQAVVSREYNPRAGFVARRDIIMTSPAVRFNWRPSWRPASVRAITPDITTFFYHNYNDLSYQQGYIAFRPFTLEFHSGARFQYSLLTEWHNLEFGFSPAGIAVDPGRYRFQQHEVLFQTDQSARFSISAKAKHGGFFNGELTQITAGAGLRPVPHLSIGTNYERNMFTNLGADSEAKNVDLLITRVRLSFSPRMHISGFWQHNTDQSINSLNLRFSWEFMPLSYIYLVFNDVHPFGDEILYGSTGRQQAIFKVTYLQQL